MPRPSASRCSSSPRARGRASASRRCTTLAELDGGAGARIRRGRQGAHRDGDRRPRGRGRDPRGPRRRRTARVAPRRDRADDPRVLRLRGQVPRRRRRGCRVPGRPDGRRDRGGCRSSASARSRPSTAAGSRAWTSSSPRTTLYVNELNTMPGFTPISMFPKCWIASGMTYPRAHLGAHRHRARARRAASRVGSRRRSVQAEPSAGSTPTIRDSRSSTSALETTSLSRYSSTAGVRPNVVTR